MKTYGRFWLSFIALFGCFSCGGDPIEKGDFDLPPQKTKKISPQGLSFNFSHCITGDLPSVDAGPDKGVTEDYYEPDGQQVRFTHKRVENSSELKELLKGEAGFSISMSPAKAGGKLAGRDSWSISQGERYYFYKIEVENPVVVMKNLKLTDEAYHLLKQKGQEAFYRRCGKTARIGYKSGGSLSQVLRMRKKKQDSKESIDSLIQASGFGFNADGKMASSDDSDSSQLQVDVFTKWKGGVGEYAHTGLADLRKLSERWPKSVARHGVVTQIISLPYQRLLAGLEDPYEDLVTEETAWFRKELKRLSTIKRNLLSLSKEASPVSQKKIRQLEKLTLILSKQIRTCQKASKLAECQDLALLFDAKQFHITASMPHPSCGVKSWHPPPKKVSVCNNVPEVVWKDKRDPSCGVERYHKGILFQKILSSQWKRKNRWLNSQFGSECDAEGVEKFIDYAGTHNGMSFPPLCSALTPPDCHLQEDIHVVFHSYALKCIGESRRFGVARYQACPVEQTVWKKVCLESKAPDYRPIPKTYHHCRVSLDAEL